MRNKIVILSTVLVMLFGSFAMANAQKNTVTSRTPLNLKDKQLASSIEAAREGRSTASPEILERIKAAYAEERVVSQENFLFGSLVGTWYVTVPGPTPAETFYAYHTYGIDGTFVETSSLLGTLAEGPAHGVWEYRRRGAVLTFELFAFAEDGSQVGRIRVRNFIRVNNDSFISDSAVDFIELDGTVIPDIATGTYTGVRVQVRGL